MINPERINILLRTPIAELKPEDIKELKAAYAELAAVVTDIAAALIDTMGAALKPLIDFYNSLPQETKDELAKIQVENKQGGKA